MFLKYLHWIGIVACVTLIVSCFLPWAYFADPQIVHEADRTFTGFYNYGGHYGKPGLFLCIFATIALILMLVPKVWAKRTNLFICALTLAYSFKTLVLYGSCYMNYCPEKYVNLYLMFGSTVIMMLAAIFPKLKLSDVKQKASFPVHENS